jgi:hypothetical protein
MAWRQSSFNRDFGATSIAGELSVAVSGNDVLTGSVICGYVWWSDTTTNMTGITDSQGNTVTVLDNPTTDTVNRAAMFYIQNASSGVHTLTASFSTGPSEQQIYVEERTGLLTSGVLDQHVMNGQGSEGPGTDDLTSTAKTTVASGEDIVGITKAQFASTPTPSTGFTQRFNAAGSGNLTAEDKVQSSSGSIAATFSAGDNDNWITGMMTFKASGGGGTNLTPTIGSATLTGTQSVVGRGIITRSMIQGT